MGDVTMSGGQDDRPALALLQAMRAEPLHLYIDEWARRLGWMVRLVEETARDLSAHGLVEVHSAPHGLMLGLTLRAMTNDLFGPAPAAHDPGDDEGGGGRARAKARMRSMDKVTERIVPPWSDIQVAALAIYQNDGRYHPYTCGNDHEGERNLVATRDGLRCPTCNYNQTWAWAPPQPAHDKRGQRD